MKKRESHDGKEGIIRCDRQIPYRTVIDSRKELKRGVKRIVGKRTVKGDVYLHLFILGKLLKML